MRAAIYSRFSTDRQNESSIADQVRVCTEYAERQGWQVVERFDDQGISGAALGNRQGVLRLQDAAFAGRFDLVLVTDLSRLSRSQGDLSKMIDRLVVKGVRVIGVQDGYDSARRGHKLQAGLPGIIGEAFREMVKDRTYAALESRAKEKRATGGRAYGYRDGKVDKGEAYIHRPRDIWSLRRWSELPHDCGRSECAAHSLARFGVESDRTSRRRLDGLRNSRHPPQRTLPRRCALEHLRVAQGPGHRQAQAHHAASFGVDQLH